MKCVLKDTIEYECFFLYTYSMVDFVEWFSRLFNVNQKEIKCDFDNEYLTLSFKEEQHKYKLNKWYVFKDDSLYDYDREIFNQLYRRI